MTTDLEDELRIALHQRAAAITAERLRPARSSRRAATCEPAWTIDAAAGPERHRRRHAGRLAPALAAAAAAVVVVVAVIVAVALAAGSGSRAGQPAGGGSGSLAGVLGHTWVLKMVRAPDGEVTPVSASISASVTFLSTGDRIEFQDGVGTFQAALTRTAVGQFRVHDVSGGPGNYGGHDRSQLAAIAGIDAIGVPPHNLAPPPISVRLASDRLVITTQGYRLTLGDPVPVAPSASRLPPRPPMNTSTTAAPAHPTGS